MNVERCFITDCIYRSSVGKCAYTELCTEDGASAPKIAEVKAVKLYRVKAHAVTAKEAIEVGLVIDQYANFIRDSYPAQLQTLTVTHSRSEDHESLVSKVLRKVFKLTDFQQLKFWESKQFEEWAARHNITVTLTQVSTTLKSVSPQYA